MRLHGYGSLLPLLLMIGASAARAQGTGASGTSGSPAAAAPSALPAERVTGIGGFFFRAANPKAIAAWYATNLGIDLTPTSYDDEPWKQEAGPTVFAPFSVTSKYFGRERQQWMLNLRVRDLDAMVAQLRRAGIVVSVDTATYPNGRFARTHDPEGNPIELWEPKVGGKGKSPL